MNVLDVFLHHGDVGSFRSSALELLKHQVHPAAIAWSSGDALSAPAPSTVSTGAVTRLAASVVPRSFLRLTDLALLHTDPQRFDLMYRLLWRVVHEPRLKDDRSDYDMQRAYKMAAAVRRELQTLQRSVAFLPVAYGDRTVFCGWAEPHFYTTEAFALWYGRRRTGTDFLAASPERCAFSRRGVIRLLPPLPRCPRSMEEWHAALQLDEGSRSEDPA
jgi:DNA polymerase